MSKFLPVLLLILSFLAFPSAVFAQSATLILGPASGTFNRGCGFSLAVELDTGGAPTDGTDAVLIYDPSRVTATSITNGTIYPEYAGNSIDTQRGTVAISGYASIGSNFTGKGTLATVNFTVPSGAQTGATQISFDFDSNNKAKTTDSNVVIIQEGSVVDVLNSVVNGNYIIGTGACSAQPSPTPSPAPGSTVTPPPGSTTYSPPVGGPYATPSAYPPLKTLPEGGTKEFTFTVAIIGSVLTVLGILGLAFL